MKFDATSYLRKRLLELKPYQSARQEFVSNGESMIFLDANESPYETDLNRYPDPLQLELKALIANGKGCASNSCIYQMEAMNLLAK